jgi:hypothetical protein
VVDISGERLTEEAREIYRADVALVRPDLHVAWRGPLYDNHVASITRRATADL